MKTEMQLDERTETLIITTDNGFQEEVVCVTLLPLPMPEADEE